RRDAARRLSPLRGARRPTRWPGPVGLSPRPARTASMSVLRLVLRHAAVNAVSGFFSGVNSPTIAGNRVFDSKIEPVENIREDAAYPTVVIYTDYDRNAFPHSGVSHQERTLTITFELLMAVMTKT